MSMTRRVTVWRGGRRVVLFRRARRTWGPTPAELVPVAPVKPAVAAKVQQLAAQARDGLRQLRAEGQPRELRHQVRAKVHYAVAWVTQIQCWTTCPQWLLTHAVTEVGRCVAWWRDLRVRLLLESCRRKRWLHDWLRGQGLGRRARYRLLTCACT